MMRRLPVLPASPAEVCEEVYAEVDGIMQRRQLAVEEAGSRVPCARGCSHCCAKPVLAELGEMPALIAGLRLLSAAQRARVWRRLREWREMVKRKKLRLGGDEESEVKALDEARLPCPLLEDKLCLVYAHRPLTCRLHAVAGSDPALCADPHIELDFVSAADLVTSGVAHIFRRSGVGRPWQFALLPTWLGAIRKAGAADQEGEIGAAELRSVSIASCLRGSS